MSSNRTPVRLRRATALMIGAAPLGGALTGMSALPASAADTALSVTALPSPAVEGQTVTFTAITGSFDDSCLKGPVTFVVDNTPVGTVPNGAGVAVFHDSALSVGGHEIGALFDPVDPTCTSAKAVTFVRIDPALTVDL